MASIGFWEIINLVMVSPGTQISQLLDAGDMGIFLPSSCHFDHD